MLFILKYNRNYANKTVTANAYYKMNGFISDKILGMCNFLAFFGI